MLVGENEWIWHKYIAIKNLIKILTSINITVSSFEVQMSALVLFYNTDGQYDGFRKKNECKHCF